MLRSLVRLTSVVFVFLATSLGSGHAEDQVKLKMQSAYRSNLPLIGAAAVRFSETVAAASGGELRFKFFEPRELVPALQIFDAVTAGTVDAGYAWPGFWVGKMPALAMFGAIPFGPESPQFLAWIHHGGGLECY